VQFWAEHFKIKPAAFRNIANYLAYPMTDPETKQVKRVLTFIDSDLQKIGVEMLGDLNRDNYF
jgi:hypothetical protein